MLRICHTASAASVPCQCQPPARSGRHVVARKASRKTPLVLAYRSVRKAAAVAEVQCIKPSSNLSVSEQAITTFGQAFMMHSLHRLTQTRLGQEQHLFAGISRCMLDACTDEPVLYITAQGPAHAAAILYTNTQEAHFVEQLKSMDFSIIPGTLQMLQAIPEGRIPVVVSTAQQLYETGTAAMHVAGHDTYLKLMLVAARPEVQGTGLGGAVLQAVCNASDQMKLPLYAEAAGDELVPLYDRYAFRVLGKAGGNVMMLREDASRVNIGA